MSDYAEAVEIVLVRDWHEDQCACREFDGVNMDTCYTRNDGPNGRWFHPPLTWTVDAVLTAAASLGLAVEG